MDIKLIGFQEIEISWPRIFPEGRGGLNKKGIDFYNRLVDELLKNNIIPFVTLYHWDMPYALEKSGGWYNRKNIFYFADFCERVVDTLKDRVKFWITLNEPIVVYLLAHVLGEHAPGHKKMLKSLIIPHNLLLAHGLAVERIRGISSDLKVGITNAFITAYPATNSEEDVLATEKAKDYMYRLFMDPIYKGKYPESFEKNPFFRIKVRKYLEEDMKIITAKLDFLGLNYYTRLLIKKSNSPIIPFMPIRAKYPGIKNTDMDWEVYPPGFYDLINSIKNDYGNPTIYITENGAAYKDEIKNGEVIDNERINYLKEHLISLNRAMNEGADVRGYFVWSFMDNFEWTEGLSKRFGLIYVDYQTQKRIVKKSGYWYGEVCKTNSLKLD